MPKILFQNKKECSGCEVCANACPVQIIQMRADDEGFWYPFVVDDSKCMNCGRCEKVCPLKHVEATEDFHEKGIAGFALLDAEIKSSASGGLATAISRKIINQGGVVFGVQYSNDCLEIEFNRAENIEELEKFKTSKYAQARKHDVYKCVEQDLKAGRTVLFIGVPCEVNALCLFLGRDYDNLYVCSLMCHGPTSPAIHRAYCENISKDNPSGIHYFSVRYKPEGWKPYYIRVVFHDGKEFSEKFAESTYGVSFLYMKRPSCNVCRIKRSAIRSDITIGDYHLASGGHCKPYNPNGVSSGMVHTEKGQQLVNGLKNFLIEEVPVKNVLYSEAYHRTIPARKNREEFGKTFVHNGLQAACNLRSIRVIDRELEAKASIKRMGAQVKKMILGKK